MGRIRTVKPEFWKHEDLSALPEATHMLAAALLNYADDEGYFNANPGLVRAETTPLREPSVPIPESLQTLAEIGYIRLGVAPDGRRYGHITEFSKHQVVNKPKESKIKTLNIAWEGDGSNTGNVPERSHPEQGTGNGVKEGEHESPPKPPQGGGTSPSSRKRRKKAREYDAEFLAWWEKYPKREAKGDAFDAYWAMRDGGHSHETLVAGAAWAAKKYADTEDQFIPLPATFLRRESFLAATEGTGNREPPDGTNKAAWYAAQAKPEFGARGMAEETRSRVESLMRAACQHDGEADPFLAVLGAMQAEDNGRGCWDLMFRALAKPGGQNRQLSEREQTNARNAVERAAEKAGVGIDWPALASKEEAA